MDEKEKSLDLINELNLDNDLRNALLAFETKIVRLEAQKWGNYFNVIIDNIRKNERGIILEYITKRLEETKFVKDTIKFQSIRDVDNNHHVIIVIDDFEEFKDEILDGWNSDKLTKDFFVKSSINENILVFSGTNLSQEFEDIDKSLFNPDLCFKFTLSNNEKDYQSLIKKYKKSGIKYKLSYKEYEKIVKSIKDSEVLSKVDIVDYLYDYSVKKLVLNDTNKLDIHTFSEFMMEENKKVLLKDLIGLKNIKDELKSLGNYLKFINKSGIDKEDIYLNMFFMGNPGTGKTTVARLMADKLYNLGFIKENKVYEITPNDLMGRYVGQTKDTVRKVLDNAKGGILFIDEAYLIDEDIKNNISYMKEALVELLKYLENSENVVIFAGYQDKMNSLYNDNPGIKSRIYKEIVFSDYTNDELYKILCLTLQKNKLRIKDEDKEIFLKYITNLKKDKDFGNARTIKTLAQKLIINHANKNIKEEDFLVTSSDLPEQDINRINCGLGGYHGV